jgi:hypothetical protein
MDQQAAHRLRVLQQQLTMVRPRASKSAAVPNTGWCLTYQPVFMQEREGVAGLSLQVNH